MKLASFNLYQFLAPPNYWYERRQHNCFTAQEWQQKQAWITEQLQHMDADVVGFQEVFSPQQLQQLVKSCGYPYFATVSEPETDAADPAVFLKPVVALASRLPIKHCTTIQLAAEVKQSLSLQAHFNFSRPPIYATLDCPELGEFDVYVAHLKSKRPKYLDSPFAEAIPWGERAFTTLQKVSRGNIAALLQRGAESTLLYHHISDILHRQARRPCVVLGDLNDDEDSIALQALLAQSKIFEIGEIKHRDWPGGVKEKLYDLRLYESYKLAPNSKHGTPPHTHIYKGEGGILDYALVNNALNPRNADRVAEVVRHQVYNRHLDADGVPNRVQSDHGQVAVTIRATVPQQKGEGAPGEKIYWTETSDSYSETLRPSNSELRKLTRAEFIDLAGGVFHASKKYKHWRGSDKWNHFWSFFFDNNHGYVKSVYGAIPVDELYQKRRHSIEHIIPKSFLNKYLRQKRSARFLRYGASVNPFNFIPADRALNASRSNFAFDFKLDNSKVLRPEHIDIEPEAYLTSDSSAKREWVIPSRSRGDIARAMLYMLLIYGINELHPRHIDTLVHWAKVDVPSDWELAYNRWVQSRLKINNPFINTREKTLALLCNRQLLDSLAAT
ncbi:MAG: endonuclease [Cellvibrionaceae bacterium]|nr:endonuclease [Cellvibrionaceae bacterium]